MRLLNTSSHQFKEYFEKDIPPYAIISHRWQDDEISFKELKKGQFEDGAGQLRSGMKKILEACSVARSRDLEWMWIDTCCIDKRSSAELSEAINSMYRWYQNSKECYVYLVDVHWDSSSDHPLPLSREEFAKSQWFLRGWTLQELLAPRSVIFFDEVWNRIGNRGELCRPIADTTGIDVEWLLTNDDDHWQPPRERPADCERKADCRFHAEVGGLSIATKMSWASKRKTSRVEDTAYCLIGIFGINMPHLYGEGEKAFQRLQYEIIRAHDDDSILCFHKGHNSQQSLADSPAAFSNSSHIMTQWTILGKAVPLDNMIQVPIGLHILAGRGLALSMTWRSFSRDSSSVRLPLHCWQCSKDGPRNMALEIYVPNIIHDLKMNNEINSIFTSFVTVKESETFYLPLGDPRIYITWQGNMLKMERVAEWKDIPIAAIPEAKVLKLHIPNARGF